MIQLHLTQTSTSMAFKRLRRDSDTSERDMRTDTREASVAVIRQLMNSLDPAIMSIAISFVCWRVNLEHDAGVGFSKVTYAAVAPLIPSGHWKTLGPLISTALESPHIFWVDRDGHGYHVTAIRPSSWPSDGRSDVEVLFSGANYLILSPSKVHRNHY